MAREKTEIAEHLDYLKRIAREMDFANSIPADLADLVGRHEDLREAARIWRQNAEDVEQATGDVKGRLGGIDSSWQGADAEAFLGHIREVGLASHDLIDSMRALADVLEHTVEGVQAQVNDLGDLVAEAADSVSSALLAPEGGPERARKHLGELAQPATELAESISDTYRAFARFCDDLEAGRSTGSVQFDRRMPTEAWDFNVPAAPQLQAETDAASAGGTPEGAGTAGTSGAGCAETAAATAGGGNSAGVGAGAVGAGTAAAEAPDLEEGGTTIALEPSAIPPAAAAAAGGAAVAGGAAAAGGMMPMGMMGGMAGGAQNGGQERKNQSRFKSKPEELFGTPPQTVPAVFGAPEQDQKQDQKTSREGPVRTGKLDIPSILQTDKPRKSIDDALHPKQPNSDAPKSQNNTQSSNPKTATASVGDALPPKPRKRG
ncbi:WXG100 family type VII secretion target [Saccharopolyspora sp. NPDC002376]